MENKVKDYLKGSAAQFFQCFLIKLNYLLSEVYHAYKMRSVVEPNPIFATLLRPGPCKKLG